MGRKKPITINETLDRLILDSSERVFYFAKKRLRNRLYFIFFVAVAASVGFAFYSLFVKANVFNYFPSSCLGTWDNPQNAQGEPSLEPDARPEEFNKDNSAFYDGEGAKQVFCGGFSSEGDETEKIFKKAILKFTWAIAVPLPPSSSGAAGGAPTQVLQQSEFESQALDLTASASIIVIPDNPASVSIPFESEDQTPEPVPDSQQAPLNSEPPLITTEQPTPVPEISVTPELTPAPTPEPALPAPEPVIENPPQPEPPPPAPAEPAPETPVSWLGRFVLASIFSDIASDSVTPSVSPTSSPKISTSPSLSFTPAPVSSPSFMPLVSLPPSAIPSSPSPSNILATPLPEIPASASASYSLDDFLEVFYTTDGQNWQSLGRVNKDNFENLELEVPITSWTELEKLQISVAGAFTTDASQKVYLDGMQIEAQYESIQQKMEMKKNELIRGEAQKLRQTKIDKSKVIKQPEGKNDFGADEEPVFEIDTNFTVPASLSITPLPSISPSPVLPTSKAESSTFLAWFKKLLKPRLASAQLKDQILVEVFDMQGRQTDIRPIMENVNGKTVTRLPKSRAFKPGKYELRVLIIKNDEVYLTSQDFTWGVLAINPDKSIYLPGETANLAMAVLDEVGQMVCNAEVNLRITNPADITETLSTASGRIRINPECRQKAVTNKPDYEAQYRATIPGLYKMKLTAVTKNGTWTINDNFEVRPTVAFDVQRVTATRIFPVQVYSVMIVVKANQDYRGQIHDYALADFQINEISDNGSAKTDGDKKVITWHVDFKKDQVYTLSYLYKAPEISPQFYLLGPLSIGMFSEIRKWQIASDQLTDRPIYFWDTTVGDIPAGWTCLSCAGGTYDNVFPLASASAGVTGGTSLAHNHGGTGAVTVSSPTDGGRGTNTNAASYGHTSTLSDVNATIGNSSIIRPKFATLKMIKAPSSLETIPANVIAIFDNATPGGTWSAYSTANDRIIMASASAGITGGADTHNHTLTWPSITGSTGTGKARYTGNSSPIIHTHAAPTDAPTNTSVSNVSRHTSVYLYKAGAGGETPLGTIAMFDIDNPGGTEWTILSGTGGVFDNSFIEASTSYSAGVLGSNTHSHPQTNATSGTASGVAIALGTAGYTVTALHQHTHPMSIPATDYVNHRPTFKTVVVAKNILVPTPPPTLTLTVDAGSTVDFGSVTPGTRKTATTRLKVDTDSANGYQISVGRDRSSPTTTLASSANTTINISDTAGGINVFDNVTTCSSAAVWVSGSSTGLGFTLWAASMNKSTTCWGNGSTATDASNKYAALQASVGASVFINTTSNSPNPSYASVGWSLDVSNLQQMTDYTGDVIFSATTNP